MEYRTSEQIREERERVCKWAKATRTRLKISVKEVMYELPVSRGNITNWEKGKHGPNTPLYIQYIVDSCAGRLHVPQYVKDYISRPEIKTRLEWYYTDGYAFFRARQKKGLSRMALAKMAGITEDAIEAIENNKFVAPITMNAYMAIIFPKGEDNDD